MRRRGSSVAQSTYGTKDGHIQEDEEANKCDTTKDDNKANAREVCALMLVDRGDPVL